MVHAFRCTLQKNSPLVYLFYSDIHVGELQKCLQDDLHQYLSPGQEVKVVVKLYLVMPFANRQDSLVTSSLTEVNSVNCKDCFSMLKESAVFDFRTFKLTSSMVNLSVSNLLGNRHLCKCDLTHWHNYLILYFLFL